MEWPAHPPLEGGGGVSHGVGDRLGRAAGAHGSVRARSGTPRHDVVGLGHGHATRSARATTRPTHAQGRATARA